MKGPEHLMQNEDHWRTSMGAWFAGERVVFRGHDLHTDLASLDWMELYLFGITGRRFTPIQMKVLNRIWTYTSYPEPRIWNNRVVALAGTARSTGALAIGAAVAVSEATIYGRGPDIRGIDFLLRAQLKIDGGEPLHEIVAVELEKRRGIPGYGRPMTPKDERIAPTEKLLREAGMENGKHVSLACDVERILLEGRWRFHMNIAALYAAICADLGFSPREYYLFMLPCFVSGMLPCFIDASDQREGNFFPLRCERIAYSGPARRCWGAVEPFAPIQSNPSPHPTAMSDSQPSFPGAHTRM